MDGPVAQIQVSVPLAVCGKCKPLVRAAPNGTHYMVYMSMPFAAILVNDDSALLCPECHRFVLGALVAMGVVLRKSNDDPSPSTPPS